MSEEVERNREEDNGSYEESDEDVMERNEFEVQDAVAKYVDEIRIARNTIPDSSDEDEDPIVVRDRGIKRGRGNDRLAIGTAFLTGMEFKEVVLDYALSSGQNVVQEKWEKNKISFKCGMNGKCKWRVYCSYDEPRQVFLVKTAYTWHSCTPNGKCKILKSPAIGRLFLDKLRVNDKFMPADIQEHIKEKWKLVSSIHQCQRGRILALKWIHQEYAEQFTHLRGYVQEILDQNKGSTAFIETYQNPAGEDVFNIFYVCFDILRKLWAGTCRPILGLDDTFLKVAVKGVLLTAVGHDANNQIYPVAWVVVQSENSSNWLWFVKQIKEDLGLEDGSRFVIISDRSKGLLNAVKTELPHVEHRMCVKHIVENLKKNHAKKDELKTLVWKLAWSYSPEEFQINLDLLRRYDLELYNDVMKEQPQTWSRAFCRLGSCCEDVDNNATESFNSTITKARAKSLIPMLETIRRQGMKRIYKRKKKANKHPSRFSEYVVDILAMEKPIAERCKIWRCTHGVFEVFVDGNSYTVGMKNATCTCGKWQITGIPCEHAYGTMIDAGLDPENYISGFFLTEMWRDTYETATNPLRGPKYWMNSSYMLVVAPPEPVLPGRKKNTKKSRFQRMKGKFESPTKKKNKKKVEKLGRHGRIIHCKSCGETGHNAAGCMKFPKEKVKRTRKRKAKKSPHDEFSNKKAKMDKTDKTDKKTTQVTDVISLTPPTHLTQATQTSTDVV